MRPRGRLAVFSAAVLALLAASWRSCCRLGPRRRRSVPRLKLASGRFPFRPPFTPGPIAMFRSSAPGRTASVSALLYAPGACVAAEAGGAAERHVRFLWLVPITAAEASLVRSKGLEALESLLEQGNVDVISPKRRSLV